MMAVTPIGLNFSFAENLTALNITVSQNGTSLLDSVVQTANAVTEQYLGLGIMVTLFIILFFVLADKTPFADFGYDDARAMALSVGAVSVFGITLMQIGFITNFKHLATVIMIFIISAIYILFYENRE